MKKSLFCFALLALLCALLVGCVFAPQPVSGSVPCVAFGGTVREKWTFDAPVTLDFTDDDGATAPFNRFALEYELSAPVKGTICYTFDNGPGKAEHSEEFYLTEADTVFSQLIDGYLDGDIAGAVKSITFEPLLDGAVTLQLKSAELDVQQVLPEEYILENGRYRLGIRLSWGGGISLLEDKQCPRQDLDNLLNHHDTGRLVQQSYYGVTNQDGYESGTYNGTVWPYNPVQGGDLYNNRSKIVAVNVTDTAVSITSRPLDWAKKDTLTYAYYSNTYTLQDDAIRVDNAVIDFSGYNNPMRDQELPAFYTVSALGNFVYYGGKAPWTGDTLTYERDLPFWGDNPNGKHYLSPDNTETWCAWVDDDDYGIGLFTPGVESLLAGRHSYNGSTSSTGNATNYVAPVNVLRMPAYERLSYSYLIATGTVQELRDVFTANKSFSTNDDLRQPLSEEFDFTDIRFENEADLDVFGSRNQTEIGYADGAAVFTATTTEGADPYVSLRYSDAATTLRAEDWPWLVLTYRTGESNSENAGKIELFYAVDMLRQATGGYSKVYKLITDGDVHSLIIPVGELEYWVGRINTIRLDYFTDAEEGDTFYLYNVQLAENRQQAQKLADASVKTAEK